MWRRVGLLTTDDSEERATSIFRVDKSANVENVRFKDLTAVTLNNAVYWDIKPQFVPDRRHIISPLQSPAS
jgi:hypothetical protein